MRCLDATELSAHLSGSLGPEARAEVERHTDGCEACRQRLEAAREEMNDSSTSTLPSVKPPPGPRERGSQLGRYLVLESIGAGGMGVVYAAYDPMLERKLAVKLVHAGGAAGERERLLREGKSIAQLSHPHIVAVFDMGTTSDDQVYVAMELVEGGSLRQWLSQERRSWSEVLEKFQAAGQGLAAAHRAGLVHRDFKPENVLVGRDGRVRVTDFGLVSTSGAVPTPLPDTPLPDTSSLPRAEGERRLTEAGALMGTPAYMAPEQWAGKGADALADQFSFCVSVWEGLYGTWPYTFAFSPSPWCPIEPPADRGVPLWLRRALWRGLSLEPSQRYSGMEPLLAALAADPARVQRLRRRIGLGAVLGVAVLAGSTWWAATRNDRLCTGAADQVARVWNPAMSRALGEGFVGSGLEGAAATWELTRSGFDAYWQGWSTQHTEACRATRVRGEQSDQVLGLRMACLQRRYDEAAALVTVFQAADREVVGRAPEAVEALVALSHCTDAEALLAPVQPPATPVLALLTGAKARFDTGGYQDALTRAAEAVKQAGTLHDGPGLAEALLLRGRLEEHLGEHKVAEQSLLEAISTAEANKHDEVTAEAATLLSLVLGARQARYAEAHAWLKLAEGSIAGLGGNPELQARMLNTKALVRYAEGHVAEAIEAHQQAIVLLDKFEPDSLVLADALNGLGNALRGARRSTEALQALERAVGILLKKVGPDSDLVATTRNGMANSFMLEGRFKEALGLYQQSLATFLRRLGPTHFRTVTTSNNIGVVLAEQGRYGDALPWFEKVLAARQQTLLPTDAKTADAHSNVGMLLVELGRLDEALAQFEKARGILQGYPLDHFSQAEALLGQARVMLARRTPATAREPLTRVLALCERKEGFRFDYTRARAQFLMGRALVEGKTGVPEGRALVMQARAALEGFGALRFGRDLREIDAWLAQQPNP